MEQPEAQDQQPEAPDITVKRFLTYSEWGGTLLLVVLIIALHVVVLKHAGGLWRDEANTVNMAASSFSERWHNLQFDSYPVLWFLVLDGWMTYGPGDSDFDLRVLGLIIGLGIAVSLIWTVRVLGARVPLLALVLLGLCPTALVFGDSLRAWGCGVLLMLLTLGLTWKALQEPRPWRILLAGLVAILSVQCNFYNAVLLLAMGLGGMAVGLRNRSWKTVALVAVGGLTAAVSLLPYVPVIQQAAEWLIILRYDVTLPWIFLKFREAVESAGSQVIWMWVVLPTLAVLSCVWRLRYPTAKPAQQESDRALFLLTTLVAAVVGYVIFLNLLSRPTFPWYYFSLMAIVAALMDPAISLVAEVSLAGRTIRLIGVLWVVALVGGNVWDAARARRTKMDLVALRLQSLSAKDDLIIVNPFYCGVSFARYYHGPTPWMMVPDIGEHRVHRFDLLKEKMAQKEPIAPMLAKIRETLRSGRRVWVVGYIGLVNPDEDLRSLPPAPHSPSGWDSDPYIVLWGRQTAAAMQAHFIRGQWIEIPCDDPADGCENVVLMMVEGWRP